MKITILLCSLITIVTAVPISDQENYHEHYFTNDNLSANINREKKSPLQDHAARSSLEPETEDTTNQDGAASKLSSMEGRNLGFKKPIIIKKKIGYHLYRDSDEEMAHADPHENCRKQVKVKLCDDETGSPKQTANCLTSERMNEDFSEKEIENSIKTAKEAVENLQRDLQNSAKMANIEDKEFEDDFEVHQNIEAARKALEHVQQNFGNLETLNLEMAARKAEDFQSKFSDEERLAQWKEAIDNIQKNFEIARNIEDAFKAETDQTNLLSTETNDLSKASDPSELNADLQQKSNTANLSKEELLLDGPDALKKQREDSDTEMFTSPTEQKELKIASDSLKSEKMSKHEEIARSNEITEKALDDHEIKTISAHKSHHELPKNSEFTPKSDETLQSESSKSDHVQESQAINHNTNELKTLENNEHDLNFKTGKNALSEMEDMNPLLKEQSNLKSMDSLSLPKSALLENTITSEKMNQHNHGHMEAKHNSNSEAEKSVHIEESVAAKSLNGQTSEEKKSQPVHMIDEHHNKERMGSTNNIDKMRAPNEQHKEHTTTIETQSNNKQQDFNEHTVMRMIEDLNLHNLHDPLKMRSVPLNGHKTHSLQPSKTSPEIHNEDTQSTKEGRNNGLHFHEHSGMNKGSHVPFGLHSMDNNHNVQNFPEMRIAEENQRDHSLVSPKVGSEFHNIHGMPGKSIDFNDRQHILTEHSNMRMTEDQLTESQRPRDPFLMHWMNEDQQRESLLSSIEDRNTHGKLDDFNIGQHFQNEHMSMRFNQDENTRHHLSDNHHMNNPLLMNWTPENQQNDLSQFAKTAADFHNEHNMMAVKNGGYNHKQNTFDDHNMRMTQQHMLNQATDDHVTAQTRFANNFDLANTHDFSQHGPRMHDHLHTMHHSMSSDMDSAMQPSMHMSMRAPNGKSPLEHNDMHWNHHHHHHAMARYGSGIPIPGVTPGAVGVFPNANTGCGIPLMLSCSPSVVSGSLAKTHPAPTSITAPAYRSGDDLMFYMKRDAKENDLPTIKIQKSSLPFSHKSELIFNKTNK